MERGRFTRSQPGEAFGHVSFHIYGDVFVIPTTAALYLPRLPVRLPAKPIRPGWIPSGGQLLCRKYSTSISEPLWQPSGTVLPPGVWSRGHGATSADASRPTGCLRAWRDVHAKLDRLFERQRFPPMRSREQDRRVVYLARSQCANRRGIPVSFGIVSLHLHPGVLTL